MPKKEPFNYNDIPQNELIWNMGKNQEQIDADRLKLKKQLSDAYEAYKGTNPELKTQEDLTSILDDLMTESVTDPNNVPVNIARTLQLMDSRKKIAPDYIQRNLPNVRKNGILYKYLKGDSDVDILLQKAKEAAESGNLKRNKRVDI